MLSVREIDHSIELIALHEFNSDHYPYLLETVAQTENQQHFSLLFAYPGATLTLDNNAKLSFKESNQPVGQFTVSAEQLAQHNFLTLLNQWYEQEKIPHPLPHAAFNHLPFQGGWFLYLGYELAGVIESTLKLPNCDDGLPMAFATRIAAALIFDHRTRQLYAVAEKNSEHILDRINEDIKSLQIQKTSVNVPLTRYQRLIEDNPDEYIENVLRTKRYIKEGDVFQVNLSRQWQAYYQKAVINCEIYAALRKHNPAPFFGLAKYENKCVISSSPERLVKVCNNTVETRPIAGTWQRSGDLQDDLLFRQALLAHPKERAEHIMLIDLERNDLGKLCIPGSIVVNELMSVESYAHVHHIVSNIQGEIAQNMVPGKVIEAVFPGGTITGCPKIRCMEIIAELEKVGRGAYTGSMGYISLNGNIDLNILIRSLVISDNHIRFRAGAGIVADSNPNKELEETRHKAKGILLALEGSDQIH